MPTPTKSGELISYATLKIVTHWEQWGDEECFISREEITGFDSYSDRAAARKILNELPVRFDAHRSALVAETVAAWPDKLELSEAERTIASEGK